MMTNSSYLSHHGIPDQKWGQRNGPPYPLKASAYSAAEKAAAKESNSEGASAVKKRLAQAREAAKAKKQVRQEAKKKVEEEKEKITKTKILNSGDSKMVYQYRNYFTNDEMKYALDRIDYNAKLSKINSDRAAAGKSWVKKALADESKALGGKAVKAITDYAASKALEKAVKYDPTGTVGKVYDFSHPPKDDKDDKNKK